MIRGKSLDIAALNRHFIRPSLHISIQNPGSPSEGDRGAQVMSELASTITSSDRRDFYLDDDDDPLVSG